MIMHDAPPQKSGRSLPRKILDFYLEGFRSMTLGKTLWLIIIIKLLIMFVIVKWVFFPDILSRDYDSDMERAEAVRENLTNGRDKDAPPIKPGTMHMRHFLL